MSDLTGFFAPRGVVVVGASAAPGKMGAAMADSLRAFPGRVALVNSRGANGMYTSVGEAVAADAAPLDLAVLCVPAAATAAVLGEAAAHGIGSALVCAGGFGEAGEVGIAYDRQVRDAVAKTGIRLVGPNTSGFFVPARRLVASFAPGAADLPDGSIAVVAASGGVNHAVSFRLARAGAGLRVGIGLGAALDVGQVDLLDHLAEDPHTSVVALHLESVVDGPALLAAVDRITRRKPVVALVVGRNDVAEFARSHTGALATSWRTARALLAEAGAVIVNDEEQLVDAAIALSGRRLAPNPSAGVGLVTAQAGPGLLIADAVHTAGADLPRLGERTQETISGLLPPLTFQANPVDTGRPGPTLGEVVRTVAEDPNVAAIGVYALVEPVIDLPGAVGEAALPDNVPVVLGVDGTAAELDEVLSKASAVALPAVVGPTSLARGLVALVQDARHQFRRGGEHLPPPAAVVVEDVTVPWDENRAKNLLETMGVRAPARRRCTDRKQAHQALAELGGPVAVKILDTEVLHKTDLGGVFLGVTSPAELDRSLDALDAIGAREYLVEAMAAFGVDLLVSARRDPVFGPVVLLGSGGTTAEVLADVTIRAAALSTRTAETMVDDLAARDLLFGWRSGPTLDRSELARILRTLGSVLLANPELGEIEINPLRLTAEGLYALDAVVLPRMRETGLSVHSGHDEGGRNGEHSGADQ